nr:MAG TPA: NikA, BACTERIAL CONJUGATION, RELAXASE, DNA [Caudoviricetes sp.]
MSPKLGQKLTDNPKNVKLNLRLTKQEAEDIQYCADKLHTTRVDVVNRGVRKVKEEIDKTK